MTDRGKSKTSRCRAIWLLIAAVSLLPCNAAGKTGTQVKRTAEQAVATDARTQQAVEAWEKEKQQLLEKIDRTRARLQNLAWQHDKAAGYCETLRGKIAELEQRAAAMEKINLELLPLLDGTLKRLEGFMAADIPWQTSERRRQCARVKELLNDYDAGLLPKTRAVLEAVGREVDLGHGVAVREAEIPVDGQPRQVRLLRVGRLGLYALSGDGRHAYAWDPENREFTSLNGGQRAIEEAMQMAEGTRILALTRLPAGRPEGQTGAGGTDGETE